MEFFHDLVSFISEYLIQGIFISVLVVWIASVTTKGDYGYAKILFKWIMIAYAALAITGLLFFVFYQWYDGIGYSGYSFSDRFFGDFWFSFWVMLGGNLITPFILLSKKISNKFVFLFLVGVMMNIGWFFERFVIIITSLHREYEPEGWFVQVLLFLFPLNRYFFRGLLLGIAVLIIGQVITRAQRKKQPIE